jgi:uncharacterized protein (TIGR02588 family)
VGNLCGGLCYFAGLVGLIFFDWQTNQNRPPAFAVAVSEAVRVTDGRYYVPFAITNTGGRIARMVQVTAELHSTGADDETGEQQIDFLSGHETKAGSFVLPTIPRGGIWWYGWPAIGYRRRLG